ncbi:MAG: ferredoxin [Chloroflexi bacterium]|nr:ferredoxin [Chloroflexota bacterium]MDA1002535.1 ferredoxin [Chloroflexota bacterium]
MPKVEINYRTCTKTGQCYYLHSEAFRRRADDHPEPTAAAFPSDQREALDEAADLCPTESITIVDD